MASVSRFLAHIASVEARRLLCFGEPGVQQTEFPLSSQEHWSSGVELIWFPPIKIICSKYKCHKMPIKVRALAQWITLEMGLGSRVRSSRYKGGTGRLWPVAQRLLGVQAPQSLSPENSPSLYFTLAEQSNTQTRMETITKSKGVCPPSPRITWWSGQSSCGFACAVRDVPEKLYTALTATLLQNRLLQHAKDRVFTWCKSA